MKNTNLKLLVKRVHSCMQRRQLYIHTYVDRYTYGVFLSGRTTKTPPSPSVLAKRPRARSRSHLLSISLKRNCNYLYLSWTSATGRSSTQAFSDGGSAVDFGKGGSFQPCTSATGKSSSNELQFVVSMV